MHGNPHVVEVVNDVDMWHYYEIMHPINIARTATVSLFVGLALKAPESLLDIARDMASLDKGWTHSALQDSKRMCLEPRFAECK